jgi:phosphate transport system substrate-binding protein
LRIYCARRNLVKKAKLFVLSAIMLAMAGMVFAQTDLVGAGATFPYPLYSKMFDEYGKEYNVKVNYQAIGSGGGIQQLKSRTVDFGASDAFMSDADLAAAPAAIVHIPTVAGAVVITFNLPGAPELRFTPDVVADIFLGTIVSWNDPRIVALNPTAALPNIGIVVVHRSDGSGTTNVFSDYLSKVSADWKTKVGMGTALSWPTGVGGKGNPGVAGLVQQLPGSIGYVELIYALQNKMTYASVRNKAGAFIKPTLATTTAALNVTIPADTRVSVTDTAAADGYPIAGFTWILVYKDLKYGSMTQAKAQELVKMLWWMIHQGQKYADPLSYSVLPAGVVTKAEAQIRSITFGGTVLMK